MPTELPMDEAFSQIALGNASQQQAPAMGQPAQFGPYQDTDCYAQFYMHPVQDELASKTENRPIYNDVLFIRIMVPGDKTSEVRRPARIGATPKHDNQKYGHQYQVFTTNADAQQNMSGTPLTEWSPIPASLVRELEYSEVRTVEQLANVSDSIAQSFRGLLTYRTRAKDWLAQAENGKHLSQMRAELQSRDDEIGALKEAVKDLQAINNNKKSGRTRAE